MFLKVCHGQELERMVREKAPGLMNSHVKRGAILDHRNAA
jgi:hypothetical protein